MVCDGRVNVEIVFSVKGLKMLRFTILMILLLVAPPVLADDPLPKFPEKFDLDGHTAYLYAAPKPAADKPWV